MQLATPLTFTLPKPSKEESAVIIVDHSLEKEEKALLATLVEKSDFLKDEQIHQQELKSLKAKDQRSQKQAKILQRLGIAAMSITPLAVLAGLFLNIQFLFIAGTVLLPIGVFTYVIAGMDKNEREMRFKNSTALLSIPSMEYKDIFVKKMVELMSRPSIHQDVKDELQKLFAQLQNQEGVLKQWLELCDCLHDIEVYDNNKKTLEVFGATPTR